MKYLDEPCTRCKSKAVVPPLKNELKKTPILVKCSACGKFSRYNVRDHADTSKGYWLSKWGRDKVLDEHRKRPATVSWSTHQEKLTRGKGETKQTLIDFAYQVKILMLDK